MRRRKDSDCSECERRRKEDGCRDEASPCGAFGVAGAQVVPAIDRSNEAGDQRAMDADVGQECEIDREQDRAWFFLTIDVGHEEAEQREENVAAGHD